MSLLVGGDGLDAVVCSFIEACGLEVLNSVFV
jgi:hypothetical protein